MSDMSDMSGHGISAPEGWGVTCPGIYCIPTSPSVLVTSRLVFPEARPSHTGQAFPPVSVGCLMGEKASSFLNNKSFHPGNAANRYKLFVAEEKKKNEDVKREELRREFEQQEVRRETKSLIHGESGGMAFMYNKPPGYMEARERKGAKDPDKEKTPAERDTDRFGQLLAHAPREGGYTTSMEVSHKPFGVELRKVQCKKCGAWGHSNGDRECPLRNQIGTLDEQRRAVEDPLARTAGSEASGVPLRWAPKALPGSGMHGGGVTAADANQQFVPMVSEEEALTAATEEGAILSQMDSEMLAMLDEKQRRKLVKMYRKELRSSVLDREGVGGEKKKHKKEGKAEKKKHKKKHKRKAEKAERSKHVEDGSSSSSSSADEGRAG